RQFVDHRVIVGREGRLPVDRVAGLPLIAGDRRQGVAGGLGEQERAPLGHAEVLDPAGMRHRPGHLLRRPHEPVVALDEQDAGFPHPIDERQAVAAPLPEAAIDRAFLPPHRARDIAGAPRGDS
ncbi:unnamed protein product, partial [Phaeothamnion confervicola]